MKVFADNRDETMISLESTVIERKINIDNLTGDYYKRLRSELKRKAKDQEFVEIRLIPNRPINEMWILETLLNLQREVTNNIIIPPNTLKLDNAKFTEWATEFDGNIIIENL
jgi:hypothetical protein